MQNCVSSEPVDAHTLRRPLLYTLDAEKVSMVHGKNDKFLFDRVGR